MMMKSILVAACFAATAFAQSVVIAEPTPDSVIFSGQELTVEVDKPGSISGSTDVSVEISIAEIGCDNPSCAEFPGPATVLFNGPYTPVMTNPHSTTLVQDFTVTIPSTFQQGDVALLIVQHTVLIGAGQNIPSVDTHNVTLTVGAPPSSKRAVAGRILM